MSGMFQRGKISKIEYKEIYSHNVNAYVSCAAFSVINRREKAIERGEKGEKEVDR